MKYLGGLTISRCNSKSSSSDPIPSDVLMDIMSRLPAKSVGKCRCVCKFWALILGRPEFEELFLSKSLSRPRQFLFAVIGDPGIPFFTSQPHQIQNPPLVWVTPHHTYLPAGGLSKIFQPVRGWVCIEDGTGMFVVCNPITGQSVILPSLKEKMMVWVKMSLGYDPIDKQFKVLCSTWSPFNSLSTPAEHYVLTLGGAEEEEEQMVWRTIECCRPIRHLVQGGDGICINGLLYYMAESDNYKDIFIVCFDTRFEKLSFINKPDGMWPVGIESRLVNHKGQLGIMQFSNPNSNIIDGYATSFCLWLLQGGGTEWTKHISQLPFLWWDLVGDTGLCIVGIRAGTCELVLSPRCLSAPIYLFYLDLERNIVTSRVTRVGIQGFEFEGFNSNLLLPYYFLDYVENLKLI